jgi:hypothetical protein
VAAPPFSRHTRHTPRRTPPTRARAGKAGATEDKFLLISLRTEHVFSGIRSTSHNPGLGYVTIARISNQKAFADSGMNVANINVCKAPTGPMAESGTFYTSDYGRFELIGKCGAFPEEGWEQGCIAAYRARGGAAKAAAVMQAQEEWVQEKKGGGGSGAR